MQTKNKFNKLYQNINESLGSNYSMGSHSAENGGGLNVGGKGMNAKPERVSMLDIIAGIEREKKNRDTSAPVIGYPLQNKIPEDLSEIVRMLAEIAGKFKQASDNPVIKGNEKAYKAAIRILKKLKKSGAIMISLKHDLDDLVVEN